MKQNKLIRPKFKVGDVVWMKNEHSFNPSLKVTSIGKIEAIHIHRGESIASYRARDGLFEPKDLYGRITYTISGFSLMPEEKDLQLFTGEA